MVLRHGAPVKSLLSTLDGGRRTELRDRAALVGRVQPKDSQPSAVGGTSTFRVAKEKIGLNGQCSLLSPLSSLLISLVVRVEAVLHERLTSMAS